MAEDYRIIGAEESPYSVKVRAYFRYKGIPHQWLSRAAAGKHYGNGEQSNFTELFHRFAPLSEAWPF